MIRKDPKWPRNQRRREGDYDSAGEELFFARSRML